MLQQKQRAMADYYPLIARAISGLDKNTGEHRRALYDRARAALVSQLRGVVPTLDETDITRERLALEEAIRKVEAEAAKRVRSDAPEPGEPSLRDRGLRNFRETVAEAEGLGGAAAEARRAAHATYEAMPSESEPHYFERPRAAEPPRVTEPALTEEALHEGGYVPPAPLPGSYEDEDDDTYTRRPARSYGGIIKLGVLLLVLIGITGAAYWQRHAIGSMVANFRSQPASKPKDASQPAVRPKIADRIGQAGQTTPDAANAPAAAVAQKVVLYDEDPNDPQGKRTSAPHYGAPRRCHRDRDWRRNSPCAPTSKSLSANCV